MGCLPPPAYLLSHLFLFALFASASTRTSYSHVMRNNDKTAQPRHCFPRTAELGIPMSRLSMAGPLGNS
ncbi:hypothetical protein V8C42DRAFT_329769 [Trichoderma barbatum]